MSLLSGVLAGGLGVVDEFSQKTITLGPVAVYSLDDNRRATVKRMTFVLGRLLDEPHVFIYEAPARPAQGSWFTLDMETIYRIAAHGEGEASAIHPRERATHRIKLQKADAAEMRRWLNKYGG